MCNPPPPPAADRRFRHPAACGQSASRAGDCQHQGVAGGVGCLGPAITAASGLSGLAIVGPLAWICALLWRRQKDNLANNPRLVRRREVERLVRRGLAELPGLAAANNAEAFYASVFRLLQEQLGERLDLPASAITEAVWKAPKPRD